MDEHELILKAKARDLSAYSKLVKIYQQGVRACLIVRLDDVSVADDLAQEAFIIAFRKMVMI